MKMITVEEALKIIRENATFTTKKEVVSVSSSLGKTLAEDIFAPISLPPFRQSIMDGYALHLQESLEYSIVGEVKTGDAPNIQLSPGEAVRIFTGAQVPNSANAVVMQEHVSVSENKISFKNNPNINQHIREKGAQIKEGDLTLKRGDEINPASIGLLKSFGIQHIYVYKKPSISIIVTGNELTAANETLEEGKIFESNSGVIQAALQKKGIDVKTVKTVKDSLEETEKAIASVLKTSDVVLISGGISVGDYDFVGTALENLGVTELFYKVLQKPGKPLYFGRKNNSFVFALPGNPASTLTCLYVYAFPLLDKLMGKAKTGLLSLSLPISHDFENNFGRALFLKANVFENKVEVLNLQNSAMLLSFAQANALVYIPENHRMVKEGDLVATMLLPQ